MKACFTHAASSAASLDKNKRVTVRTIRRRLLTWNRISHRAAALMVRDTGEAAVEPGDQRYMKQDNKLQLL